MDHRYNADFAKAVASNAKWATRHSKCLHELVHRREGAHTCTHCRRSPQFERLCVSVVVNGTSIKLRSVRRRGGSTYTYTCVCGTEQQCACAAVAVNFVARFSDRMAKANAQSVVQCDLLVDELTDDEAAQYGALRDAFLKEQHVKHRAIERVRQASADERTSQGGEFVYFVGSDDNRIKIGTSANVEKRVAALQTSSATKLTLLLTIPGSTELETELHHRFAHIRESGEWFKAESELRHFIEGAAFYKALGTSSLRPDTSVPPL